MKVLQLSKVACLALVSNFDNSKNFTFCETHGLTWCSICFLFIYLFSFKPQYPNSPNPVKRNWKNKKRKKRKRKKETKPRNPM